MAQGTAGGDGGIRATRQGRHGDRAISEKHKELMALAIGITQHCSGCIGFHVKFLRRLGCTMEELEEMLAVCVYMGAAPH